MSSSFRSAKKDDDDVESLVGTTKYAGGAGLQKWDKAVLVDLGTGEQPWLKARSFLVICRKQEIEHRHMS